MKMPKWMEGLVWAVVSGAATSALELRQYLTQWKDWDIDWAHMATLAVAGGVFGGAMFLRDLAKRHEIEETKQTAVQMLNAQAQAMAVKANEDQVVPPTQPG